MVCGGASFWRSPAQLDLLDEFRLDLHPTSRAREPGCSTATSRTTGSTWSQHRVQQRHRRAALPPARLNWQPAAAPELDRDHRPLTVDDTIGAPHKVERVNDRGAGRVAGRYGDLGRRDPRPWPGSRGCPACRSSPALRYWPPAAAGSRAATRPGTTTSLSATRRPRPPIAPRHRRRRRRCASAPRSWRRRLPAGGCAACGWASIANAASVTSDGRPSVRALRARRPCRASVLARARLPRRGAASWPARATAARSGCRSSACTASTTRRPRATFAAWTRWSTTSRTSACGSTPTSRRRSSRCARPPGRRAVRGPRPPEPARRRARRRAGPPRPADLRGHRPGAAGVRLTSGEMARYVNAHSRPRAKLTVIRMRGWRRDMTWTQTGRPWTPPSRPEDPTGRADLSGPCALRGNRRLRRRGTRRSYRMLCAPWLDRRDLAARASKLGIPATPVTVVPARCRAPGNRSSSAAVAAARCSTRAATGRSTARGRPRAAAEAPAIAALSLASGWGGHGRRGRRACAAPPGGRWLVARADPRRRGAVDPGVAGEARAVLAVLSGQAADTFSLKSALAAARRPQRQ